MAWDRKKAFTDLFVQLLEEYGISPIQNDPVQLATYYGIVENLVEWQLEEMKDRPDPTAIQWSMHKAVMADAVKVAINRCKIAMASPMGQA